MNEKWIIGEVAKLFDVFFSLMIAVGVVIGIGTQSIMGRKLGESNIKEANDRFKTSLILMLGLGVKGAALAAGLGYSIAFVMAILPFITGRTTLKLFQGSFKKEVACNIIYNGSSEGLGEMGTGITTFLFN